MDQLFARLKEILTIGTRQLFIVALIAWVALLVPDVITDVLGVTTFRSSYRSWIGLGTFLSSGVLVAGLMFDGWIYMRGALQKWTRRAQEIKSLRELTAHEQECLRHYVYGETLTIHFKSSDGVVLGLADKGLIRPMTDLGGTVPFNLERWAYDYLRSHPDLLKDADQARELRNRLLR